MKRASVAILTLLALAAAPVALHAQAEVSPPSLGQDKTKKPGNEMVLGTDNLGAQAPIELYRSGMAKILVETGMSATVDGGLVATVKVVSAQGRTYNYVLQSKNGAANLQAALVMAEQLRECKKLVIHNYNVLPKAGTMMQAFTIHVFDNT